MRNEWEGTKKTDSLERPSALDNKNLNSYYRIIEIILIIANPIIAKSQRKLSDTASKPAVIDDCKQTCFMAAR